jgi:CheY-like chemotaxis protein
VSQDRKEIHRMRILLIEDNDLVQAALLRFITSVHPLAVTDVVDNAPEAIDHLTKFTYDYVVSDFDLRVGTGGDVLRHVREHLTFYIDHDRFILMTGNLRSEVVALDHPLTFEKPIMLQQLSELLTQGLRRTESGQADT